MPTMLNRAFIIRILSLFITLCASHSCAEFSAKSIENAYAASPSHASSQQKLRQDFQAYQSFAKKTRKLNAKIRMLAQLFRQRPYVFDPAGDDTHGDFDTSPSINTQAFDCLSYINTLLAFLQSTDFNTMQTHHTRIRYKTEEKRYFNRHHFMSVDWNRYNVAKKYIQDITHTLVDPQHKALAETMTTPILRKPWLAFQSQLLKKRFPTKHRPAFFADIIQRAKTEKASSKHIPLKHFFRNNTVDTRILKQIPSGSIIEFTCPHRNIEHIIGTRVQIAHLGILYRHKGVLMLSHASSDTKKITNVPLAKYLQRIRDRIPFIEGVSLFRIVPPKTSCMHV